MFDQLGAFDVGDNEGRLHARIKLPEDLLGALGVDADHNAIGLHEIMDRGTFAEKLGVGGDVEPDAPAANILARSIRGW